MEKPRLASELIGRYILYIFIVAIGWPFIGIFWAVFEDDIWPIILPYKYWWLSLMIIALFVWRRNISYKLSEPRRKKEQREKERILTEKIEKEQEEQKKRESAELAFEKEQNAKGLFKFENKWGTLDQIKKWKEYKFGIDKNFMNMSHFQFEEFVAELFKKMGYTAKVTRKTGDYGVDVVAKKDNKIIAIQCKQNRIGNNVGAVTVQNTLGSMWKVKADKSIIVTTSEFTTQAEEQAKRAPIELWDGNYLQKMVRKYFIETKSEKNA